MRFYHFAVLAAVLGGCATVTRGTETNVQFESSPAGAEVRTQLVDMCAISECATTDPDGTTRKVQVDQSAPQYGPTCTTPCSVRVSRKQALIATFTKAGYEPQTVNVALQVANAGAAGLAGNVLIGGVVGLGVDAISGAALEHVPNPVVVTLRALPPVQPPPAPRRKR